MHITFTMFLSCCSIARIGYLFNFSLLLATPRMLSVNQNCVASRNVEKLIFSRFQRESFSQLPIARFARINLIRIRFFPTLGYLTFLCMWEKCFIIISTTVFLLSYHFGWMVLSQLQVMSACQSQMENFISGTLQLKWTLLLGMQLCCTHHLTKSVTHLLLFLYKAELLWLQTWTNTE